ncbi:MAG: porin [Burkholderiales bacterium]|nr:porin [Burkholderiales bacterium]
MRKSLLASAVLAAIAVPALADSVTVYGQANAALEFASKDAGGAAGKVTTTRVDAGSNLNTPSRIGFKGEEDLGGGLKAWFQIEQAVALDDAGADGNTNSNFASREGWVGLSGDFGKFGLGRGKSPYTNLADTFDGLVDAAGNLESYNVDSVVKGTNGVITKRFNNAVRYDTNSIEGFKGAIMYGTGENKTSTTPNTNYFSIGANYTAGALFVGAAYNDETNLGGVSGVKHDAWLLAGTYSIDTLKFGLGYQTAKQTINFAVPAAYLGAATTINTVKRDAFLTSVSYGMGPTTLKAGAVFFQKAKLETSTLGNGDVANSDFVRWTLGADYAFSKATYALFEISGDSIKGAFKGSPLGNAAVPTFNAAGALTSAGAATTSAVSFGLSHKF